MIADRMIEAGSLHTDGTRASIGVRMPWYRALPASSIAGVELTVDGVTAPADSITWRMNDRDWRMDELPDRIDEWWFVADTVTVSGDLAVEPGEHTVGVELKLYIPYIVTDHGVLLIDERAERKEVAS